MSSDEKVRTGKKRRARMNNSLADIIGWNGDKSDLYREIGRFVFEYSQLEAELRRIFRKKVSIDLEHNDIMTAAFDFAKLVTAILAASAIEEDRQDGKPDPVLVKLLKAPATRSTKLASPLCTVVGRRPTAEIGSTKSRADR
ncbi:hypothetical protein ACVWW6_008579 [Bradyrhizobium sp. USDA 3311]|uniref:hypothetical protein n=1 Tax=Bradyrhizobium sp. LCT2 TaxID=2493093 RepID=UPI001FEF1EA4|nr:hypothetical protein [Bradyrhizobium sp. LCT2]